MPLPQRRQNRRGRPRENQKPPFPRKATSAATGKCGISPGRRSQAAFVRNPVPIFASSSKNTRRARLHYDLRLELDGVYKSWAVTKGPSLDPHIKRLAVHVEDHPIDYGDFEGIIPKGEYGGGAVMIWDRGFWRPEGDPAKGYAKGHLAFELDGEKLHGRWHLVRTKPRPGDKKEQWLLFKSDDEFAHPEAEEDILEAAPDSVATRRTMDEIAADQSAVWSSAGGLVRGDLSPAGDASPNGEARAPLEEARSVSVAAIPP